MAMEKRDRLAAGSARAESSGREGEESQEA
jgi:hypothetical protein